jgi:hypothetical protein
VKVESRNEVTDRTASSANFAFAVDIPNQGGKGASTYTESTTCVGGSECGK